MGTTALSKAQGTLVTKKVLMAKAALEGASLRASWSQDVAQTRKGSYHFLFLGVLRVYSLFPSHKKMS